MLKELRRQKPAHPNPEDGEMHLPTNLGMSSKCSAWCSKGEKVVPRGDEKWIRRNMRQRGAIRAGTSESVCWYRQKTASILRGYHKGKRRCRLSAEPKQLRYFQFGTQGEDTLPAFAARMRTERLCIRATAPRCLQTASAGLNLCSSWQLMCPTNEQKSAQLGSTRLTMCAVWLRLFFKEIGGMLKEIASRWISVFLF